MIGRVERGLVVRGVVGPAARIAVAAVGLAIALGTPARAAGGAPSATCARTLTAADRTGAGNRLDPAVTATSAPGVYLWLDEAAWHLRFVHPGPSRGVLTGQVRACAPIHVASYLLHDGDRVDTSADGTAVALDLSAADEIDGFEFNAACPTTWTLALQVDGSPVPPAEIFVGSAGVHPAASTFALPSCTSADNGTTRAAAVVGTGLDGPPPLLDLADANAGWRPMQLALQPALVYGDHPRPTAATSSAGHGSPLGGWVTAGEVAVGVAVVGAAVAVRRTRRAAA